MIKNDLILLCININRIKDKTQYKFGESKAFNKQFKKVLILYNSTKWLHLF